MAKKETTKKLKEQKKQLEKEKKNKKGKKDAAAGGAPAEGAAPNVSDATIDRSQLTAEQLTQIQMEEAIKESQDPSSRLKKLRSPFNVRSCLLNILILVVLTVGIVLLCCFFLLDRETFSLAVVVKDIFKQFGITKFFRSIGNWFKKVF